MKIYAVSLYLDEGYIWHEIHYMDEIDAINKTKEINLAQWVNLGIKDQYFVDEIDVIE